MGSKTGDAGGCCGTGVLPGMLSHRLLLSSADGKGMMWAPRKAGCHLDPGLFISDDGSSSSVLGRSLIVDRLEGTQRVHFYPCCAAITQAENKASFFMQRCTMVNMRKACLGGMQVSNQFQNGSSITTDVYLIYFFFWLARCLCSEGKIQPDTTGLARGCKKVQKSPAAEWHVSLVLLYSFTTCSRASNCTGTSCTLREAKEPSCCGDQNWACTHQLQSLDLEKPHFPASVRSSPTSQEQEWQLRPGVSFLQEASGLVPLCASSEKKQLKADSQGSESPFCRKRSKMPRSCGLPAPTHLHGHICSWCSRCWPYTGMVAQCREGHQGSDPHRRAGAKLLSK